MSSTDTTILGFIAFLARMCAMFRKVALFAENVPILHSISTSVIPSKAEPSDYAVDGVIISIALNAELVKPLDADRQAIGMSLLLRHTGGFWLAEAEVGWSGQSIGWDDFDSREIQCPSIEEIIQAVPPL